MMRFILLFILSFQAFAQGEVCLDPPRAPLSQLAQHTYHIVERSCTKEVGDDGVLDMAIGCLSGGGNAVVGMVKGFIELLRLLVVDAPSYLFKEAKDKIQKLLSGDLNPLQMAATIASLNMSSQSGIWDKAVQYWDAFKKFSGNLKNQLVKEIKGFPCLTPRKQSQIVCRGVSEVFLFVFSPTKFLSGAKWTLNTAKALNTFVKETKAVEGLSELSVAERLRLAGDGLKRTKEATTEVMKLRNSRLIEKELPNGEVVLMYEQKVKGKDGKIHTVSREVPVDAKTKSIDANSVMGKQIMTEAVSAQAGKGSLVFIDVNHLGKVNYFKGGTQTGDQYLTSVAESLRKTLRPGDMIFKNGGDELVVVLANNNPKIVKEVTQRMMNEVDRNPQVRQTFRQEVKALTSKYKEVNLAKKYDDLPLSFKNGLTPEEKKKAAQNFSRFQTDKKAELKSQFSHQATYRGSVSVGASLVKHNETVTEALARAEALAAKVKTEYKMRYGHDVSKYNVDTSDLVSGARHGPPLALDPQ